MTRQEFIQSHWTYYLMLEKKFIATTNYVELSPENFSTFSNEYASLLQLIGAELDCFFKVYCGFDPEETKNIFHYANVVLRDYPEIKQQEIELANRDIVIKPFESWDVAKAKQSLIWWEAFDNVKHNRVGKKVEASLENVLNILAALFLLEMKWLKKNCIENAEADIPNEESTLFSLKGWNFQYMSGGDAWIWFVENALKDGSPK